MVYLDNHATTQVEPHVLQAMIPALTGPAFGNPSSSHQAGVAAARLLEEARCRVANVIPGADFQVLFTSGATEANALALRGRAPKGRRKHLVVTALEHPSIIENGRHLERQGCQLTVVPPDPQGLVDAQQVVDAVDDRTALVAVMLVNNEVGTVQPAAKVARAIKAQWPACHVHVDAVQAVGWVDLAGLAQADSIALSAHKIHGPKGVGALLFGRPCPPRPLWLGGGQEGGLRSGTVNVAGAVGLAAALDLALADWPSQAATVAALRDRLVQAIKETVADAYLVGHPTRRSPANATVAVPGLTGDAMVGALEARGVIASTGSACHGGTSRPSMALQAMNHRRNAGTVRFGLSRHTTEEDVDQAANAFGAAVAALRG
jgi:cysteine desulfurase